ncbi:kunitz-type serine protease inhibitor homolog dendrotoxin B-like [Drosophila hydei]|uniref:Kunitz-type serine protease inhibitor homolog dendrotoxin B-like n=1 Tax=Drosophila hydei TaxID=7224 RepID=A0A6J1M357_DROHY|nr:kunitz-type serine protease inhibitor homolog dendrotoxin B-like [Drosophila hydei]
MKFFLLLVICGALQVNSYTTRNPICKLPHSFNIDVYTSCLSSVRRWTYNSAINKCIKFTYLGCEGNANNFPDSLTCKRTCVRK